ncbi:4-(cytidine 5'-diphospho)-2-C-methyl-D-erythritol kinase [Saliniradius amylolyticus]|uniref:4-diphosphocytidyl-2-C-methyl-D-erythritol kinase n=1 Tax=Saliniradius amylolyticus TaxID=2183582 RepID=A0A2S2E1I5_9ALTE|nr:4-(cytidine 5'-diphospho)-2-C-methyl-D-erythritol kinase [Saliniradius amylolyticus]
MPSKLTRWPAPAKLNLFLHILGRRSDGYHQLQSLFQMLDYGDSLQFSADNSGQISLETSIAGVPNEDNLIVRAAKLLQQYAQTSQGARIWLHKTLPMGGGIGGGSSNAATTLVALNYYWQLNLTTDQLAELGLQLGADVPVFVHGQTAFADGVGEQLKALPQPERYYLVVTPDVHISTAEVFGHPQLPRNTQPIAPEHYHFEDTHNDCQELVCQRHPLVAKALQALLEYAPSRMTGTGASVFAVFPRRDQAEQALQSLPASTRGFIAKGVNCSPLIRLLQQLTDSRVQSDSRTQ